MHPIKSGVWGSGASSKWSLCNWRRKIWPRCAWPDGRRRLSLHELDLASGLSRFAAPAKNIKVVQLGLRWRWVLALGVLCGLASVTGATAGARGQQSANPAAADSSDAVAPKKSSATDSTRAKTDVGAKVPAKKPVTASAHPAAHSPTHPASHPPTHSSAKAAAAKRKKRPMSPRVRRIRQAFVASSTLRPMAQQLIQDRSPAGYAGVEAYARAHSKEDAGALAWLVVGYARVLDHDCPRAVDPLNRAKPLAGDLGDYVGYYLGTCYLQTGHQAEGLAALANFETTLSGFAVGAGCAFELCECAGGGRAIGGSD